MHGLKTAFYFSCPGPNLQAQRVGQDAHAEKKAFSVLEKVRIPNGKVNQAVFNRLYKKPMTQGLVSRSHEHPLKSHPNLGTTSNRYQAMNISYEKKEQASYLVLERQRHIQDDNKKFTWESLEKMNLNELKG